MAAIIGAGSVLIGAGFSASPVGVPINMIKTYQSKMNSDDISSRNKSKEEDNPALFFTSKLFLLVIRKYVKHGLFRRDPYSAVFFFRCGLLINTFEVLSNLQNKLSP